MLIDSDAIVKKNPFSLPTMFQSDVVLARGCFPEVVKKKWGFTGCACMAIFKSSAGTCMSPVTVS